MFTSSKCIIAIILFCVKCAHCFQFHNDWSLEELKQLAYPHEYGRQDMTYETIKSSELGELLVSSRMRHVENLHLTINAEESGVLNVSNLHKLQHLTELWIVKPPDHGTMQMNIYSTDFSTLQDLKLLTKVHIKFPYSWKNQQMLPQFISNITHLKVLELVGLRYPGHMFQIVNSLVNKPLEVLKLNQVQLLTGASDHDAFKISPRNQLLPLANSSLKCIEMCENYFITIGGGLYDVLPHLMILNVSGNMLSTDKDNNIAMAELFLNPVLEVIDISNQFVNYPNSRSKRYISRPKPQTDDPDFPGGIKVKWAKCIFSNRSSLCEMVRCVFHDNISCSLFPQNQTISSLIDFNCAFNMRLPIGRRLKKLSIDRFHIETAQIYYKNKKISLCTGSNQLEEVSFSQNAYYLQFRKASEFFQQLSFKGLNFLSKLDLSFNKLNLSIPFAFGITSLTHIHIQGNLISFNNSNQESICDMQPKLTYLDISEAGINSVPSGFFAGCKSNHLRVNLRKNKIDATSLSHDLPNMLKLRYIDITTNKIQYFTEDTREALKMLTGEQTQLNLTGNPFNCICSKDSIETIKLIHADQRIFTGKENYQCDPDNNKLGHRFLLDITSHDINKCYQHWSEDLLIAITVVSLVTTLGVCIILSYIYRFHLLTRYFRFKHGLFSRRSGKSRYKYDAFVSYCSEDRCWVHDVLMPKLEGKYRFKLCIHYRDFRLGEHIDEEIVQQMAWSRAHIIVLSDNSIKKMWPKFELQRAYTESADQEKDIIIIKYGDIHGTDVSGLVRQILDSRIYIQWPDVKDGKSQRIKTQQESFWVRLAAKLYGKSHKGNIDDIIDESIRISDAQNDGFSETTHLI